MYDFCLMKLLQRRLMVLNVFENTFAEWTRKIKSIVGLFVHNIIAVVADRVNV